MITLYYTIKMFVILVTAMIWLMVWAVAGMVFLTVACFYVLGWAIKGLIYVVTFIALTVREVRAARRARIA